MGDRIGKFKRYDEYQPMKCHAFFQWNSTMTLCGRNIRGGNVADVETPIDCYSCLAAIERIEEGTGHKLEEIVKAISTKEGNC